MPTSTSRKISYPSHKGTSGIAAPYIPSPKRTIQWIGAIGGALLTDITEQIKALVLENPLEPINLVVTSHGGPTGIGMSFFDSMRAVYRPILHTIGSGDVDSSGIIVFLTGERRFLTPHTTLLLHLAGRCFDAGKRFTTNDLECMLKEDRLKDFHYASVIADQSSGRLSARDVLNLMEKNTVLTAEDAVNYGLAHAILN